MCFNFALNRRFSFEHSRHRPWPRQFAGFVAASSIGAVINYLATLFLATHIDGLKLQLAALIGIAVGTTFNFIASRYLVFRTTRIRVAK